VTSDLSRPPIAQQRVSPRHSADGGELRFLRWHPISDLDHQLDRCRSFEFAIQTDRL